MYSKYTVFANLLLSQKETRKNIEDIDVVINCNEYDETMMLSLPQDLLLRDTQKWFFTEN